MNTAQELVELLGSKLTRFFHDNFFSTEQITEAFTGQGYAEHKAGEITQHTGIPAAGSAMMWYDYNIFNPMFSELILKARVSSADNTFAFFGFKETTDVPAFDMVESHAGFMIYNGQMYYSTGYTDGAYSKQQRIPFEGFDPRNYLIYKIEGNKFSIRQLSVIVPYFNGLQTIIKARDWKLIGENNEVTPRNGMHYIVAYIENNTNAEKYLRTEHITYAEDYSD